MVLLMHSWEFLAWLSGKMVMPKFNAYYVGLIMILPSFPQQYFDAHPCLFTLISVCRVCICPVSLIMRMLSTAKWVIGHLKKNCYLDLKIIRNYMRSTFISNGLACTAENFTMRKFLPIPPLNSSTNCFSCLNVIYRAG